jgi:hypothetical protein
VRIHAIFILCVGCLVRPALTACAGDDKPPADSKPSGLEQSVTKIQKTFGVRVHYSYDPVSFFPEKWRRMPVSAEAWQIEYEEAARTIPIIESFLRKYSRDFLLLNLKDVYLVKRMKFIGRPCSGTYSNVGIYIANEGEDKGYSRTFLEGTMHSEFSSILFANYDFPIQQWTGANEKDWKYKGYGKDFDILDHGDLFEHDDDLLEKGFLSRYAQASIEEDFNTYVECFVERPHWLQSVAFQRKRISQKLRICRDFYKEIDSGVPVAQWDATERGTQKGRTQ